MAMNRIQFQPGLSMSAFLARYGTEARCQKALAQARWPQGFACPRCGGKPHSRFERGDRTYWQCRACRYQTTVTAGTIFQATKLPLTGWFLAMHLVTQAKNNISALALMRHLGVSYKTAWSVKHRLMEVMARGEARRQLLGPVLTTGVRFGKPGAEGAVFTLDAETDAQGRPLYLRLHPPTAVNTRHGATGHRPCAGNPAADSKGPANLSASPSRHAMTPSLSHDNKNLQRDWTRAAVANFRTAISGTYHAIDLAKYGHRYLGEALFRFNHRFDLSSILDNLLSHAVSDRPLLTTSLRSA